MPQPGRRSAGALHMSPRRARSASEFLSSLVLPRSGFRDRSLICPPAGSGPASARNLMNQFALRRTASALRRRPVTELAASRKRPLAIPSAETTRRIAVHGDPPALPGGGILAQPRRTSRRTRACRAPAEFVRESGSGRRGAGTARGQGRRSSARRTSARRCRSSSPKYSISTRPRLASPWIRIRVWKR